MPENNHDDSSRVIIFKRFGLWFHQHCLHDCCTFRRPPHSKPVHFCAYCQVVSAKFLLEVCGASGAVWGSSEVLRIRNFDNNPLWRRFAIFVGLIFLVRFWWHAKHYYQHERDFPPIKLHHRRNFKLPFLQIFSTKFILEVCGGAGAIWGCSQILTLRNDKNQEDWRVIAIGVGVMFAIRWVLQILTYCLCLAPCWSSSVLMTLVRWYEALVIKLILEVFGAAGAVWGFSEVIGLRKPETIAMWRPLALGTGVAFTWRWLFLLYSFIQDESSSTNEAVHHQGNPEEIQDLEIADLTLRESSK